MLKVTPAGRKIFMVAYVANNGQRRKPAIGRFDLPLDFEGKNAIIATHRAIDIATFRITPEEIEAIGKKVLTGCQKTWPPGPPQHDRDIYYSGFPGRETIWLSPGEISFGAVMP